MFPHISLSKLPEVLTKNYLWFRGVIKKTSAVSLTPQSLTSRSRCISDSAVDDINEWYRGDWLRVSLTPKSPRNNLEPLHKNVLTHESWAQFSYIHEKQCWNFHDTIPLNWRRKKLSRIIYNIFDSMVLLTPRRFLHTQISAWNWNLMPKKVLSTFIVSALTLAQ